MKLMHLRMFGVGALALTILASCGPTGRIKSDDEDDLVGSTQAGAGTFRRLIRDSVADLLKRPSAQRTGSDRLKVAFLDIENRSMEELVDWRDTLRQLIDQSVNASGRYVCISDRYVTAALRANALRPDELFVPEKRRLFLRTLEANGSPVEFLLHASLNSGTTGRGSQTQRDYILTLELVDVETGEAEKVNADVRKEYLR